MDTERKLIQIENKLYNIVPSKTASSCCDCDIMVLRHIGCMSQNEDDWLCGGYQTHLKLAGEQMDTERKFADVALEIGKLVDEKNAAYGDSFSKSGEIIRILYPNGVSPNQVGDMLAIVRVIDKLFRIATQKDAFGENPWRDIAGYAILAVANGAVK